MVPAGTERIPQEVISRTFQK